MTAYTLPNGMKIFGNIDERTDAVFKGRHKAVLAHCERKGWDPDDLTIDQILAIRATPEGEDPIANPLPETP